jgi:hypothetical protein
MKYFSQPTGRSSTCLIILTMFVATMMISCSKKTVDAPSNDIVATKDSSADSSLISDAGQNPCSLLEPKEVEAVLGMPLAGPPYRFNKTGKAGPAPDGESCRYETAGYHYIEVEVEWKGGAQMMKMYGTVQNLADQKMKGVLKLGDGSELAGEWDEAKVVNCCTFIAMRGDQLVTVDVAGSTATLEQAARIADAALKRIDKPLAVKGSVGVAAAVARDATRPKERDPCSLVSRTEAEAALEFPLVKNPVVEDTKCIYTYTGTGSRPISIGLNVRWRNGFAVFRQQAALVAAVGKANAQFTELAAKAGSVGKVFDAGYDADSDKKGSAVPDSALAGPWEAAQVGMLEFSAVKKDVLIKADAGDNKQLELARKLIAAAMSKL